jgi:group II intron reverse transcriptase/maturase
MPGCTGAHTEQGHLAGRTYRNQAGRLRPLGVAALEDKILQRAVVEVLNAVYEQDFLGFSYGFRPGRSPHHALDALAAGIRKKNVRWVLDADIRDYFSSLDHSWLERFIEHRIADPRILRLIQRWLRAGVIEDGEWSQTLEGTPQGASVSTLLANVYFHYVFDLWAHQWRTRHARGGVLITRFADDFVVGFEHRDDAERFWAALRERFAKFGLGLHEDKTRLIEFGRFAAKTGRRADSESPKRSTSWASRTSARRPGAGGSCSGGSRARSDCGRKLRAVKAELMRRRHLPVPDQGEWLASVLRGHYNYYAVPGNTTAVRVFRYQATRHWRHALRRRSQRTRVTWERMDRLSARWLPPARVKHPWPEARFDARTQGRSPVR